MTKISAVPVLPEKLPDDPMRVAESLLQCATNNQVQRNPNSMMLITVDANGRPQGRVVLCKSFVADPGYLVFYTNYKSDKIQQLDRNPEVGLVFHWDALGRQVRINGIAVRSPASESEAYFRSRDWGSQVGAWGSDQSAPIESREKLKTQVRERAIELGVDVSADLQSVDTESLPEIPRPGHWGGVRVWAAQVEVWIEGEDRVHDRACWTRSLTQDADGGFDAGNWTSTRLQP